MTESKERVTIIVNGREKVVESEELTYDQVVNLVFNPPPSGPNIMIKVSYRDGAGRPPTGELVPGNDVKIKNGTVFNVTATDKS